MIPTLPIEDKENFNPDLNSYSPRRLVHQKRYKVLKAFALSNRSKKEEIPLKEKEKEIEKKNVCKEERKTMKKLEFEEETGKRFGI